MRKYFAEFIGTFVLTFMSCGVASFTAGYQGFLGVVGIALIFGLTFTAMAYSIGNISGCHINPAVSFGILILGRMKFVDFMGYVIAQMFGGIAAGFAILGISKTFSEDIISQYSVYGYDLLSFGTNGYGDESAFLQVNMWGALIIEAILTFVFVTAVLGVTAKKEYKSISGIVIGLALAAVHLFGIPFTGTGVNPARSFGPALAKAVDGNVTALSQVWVFIVAPLFGAALAALVYMLLTFEKKSKLAAVSSDEQPVSVNEASSNAESEVSVKNETNSAETEKNAESSEE